MITYVVMYYVEVSPRYSCDRSLINSYSHEKKIFKSCYGYQISTKN